MPTLIETNPNSWVFRHDFPSEADDSLDRALDLYDQGDDEAAEEALRNLLLVCPDHIDALHHLALIFSDRGLELEAYLCTREAVRVGLDSIPTRFSWLTSQLHWGHLENRPFMRAYHALGLALLARSGASAAVEIFARLVSVNRNDNLGARYNLMQCYLDLADWYSALAISAQYLDDVGPDIAYSKVVALVALGQDEEARAALKEAVASMPIIANELLKAKHSRPKSRDTRYITVGGEDQAFDYWERNRSHWSSTGKAGKLLRQVAKR